MGWSGDDDGSRKDVVDDGGIRRRVGGSLAKQSTSQSVNQKAAQPLQGPLIE